MTKNILTIVGARPQFIKAGALSRAFKAQSKLREILVHTGQHHDQAMSNIFFDELQIPEPKYHLNIHGGSHGNMTGRMLQALDEIFIREKPDGVLVYGDTNSTLAGALSAAKFHIPVIHIEAGLRSYNKKMPEEINRILTDHVSSLLFCPTQTAVSNLTKEGITKNVHWVGDVMYDATRYAIEQVKNLPLLGEKFSFLPKNFIFMTVHREESTSSLETFSKLIGYAIDFCAPSINIVFPLHPRTRPLVDQLPPYLKEKIFFIPPLSYLETQLLLTKAHYVLTDSGGLQKEAYFHQVPCITLRSETEWVETVEAGWNQLWTQPYKKSLSKKPIDDYGAGNASDIIMNIISDFLE